MSWIGLPNSRITPGPQSIIESGVRLVVSRPADSVTILKTEPGSKGAEMALFFRAATSAAVTRSADALAEASELHGYGRGIDGYGWGSNGAVARACMNLVVAFRLTDDRSYLDTCARQLDFLLGRNAFGRSQVTGVGDRPPIHPHHRPSQASGHPWPGLLVGGLNYASQDNPRVDEETLPGLAWFDSSEDYFTNEVAINWNAALVYALAAMRMP